MSGDLRDRLAAALRGAAHDCDGNCGKTDAECVAAHPVQAAVLHFGEAAVIEGPVEALADAVMPTVQAALEWWHKARQDDLDQIGRLSDERDAALATLARVRKYAELMTDSVVVPARGYGVNLVHMLDCDQEHATIAEQDACPGAAGAGSTQDGAQ